MFWKGINQYRSISSMSTCYYLSGFYTPCVRRCVLTTSLVAKEDYSLQEEASIFVWERLWYSISLWQQEILHCAGCKKMLRLRASSELLWIKKKCFMNFDDSIFENTSSKGKLVWFKLFWSSISCFDIIELIFTFDIIFIMFWWFSLNILACFVLFFKLCDFGKIIEFEEELVLTKLILNFYMLISFLIAYSSL